MSCRSDVFALFTLESLCHAAKDSVVSADLRAIFFVFSLCVTNLIKLGLEWKFFIRFRCCLFNLFKVSFICYERKLQRVQLMLCSKLM